jgi:DNA-binding transcriptional ArsR family regulator
VPATVRPVGDVETLKALSDPVRLGILRVLMQTAGGPLPVRSVKELAAELGEPITKLYRHVKMLESRGLIEVAESNLVSGIVERRYRAAQVSLRLDAKLLGAGHEQQVLAVDVASFDRTRDDYVAAAQAPSPDDPAAFASVVASVGVQLDAERFAEFRQRLTALIEDLGAAERADGAPVRFFCAFFRQQT